MAFQILTFFRIDLANMIAQCLIDALKSSLNKTSIKQLQVAVPLRMNTASYVKNRAYLMSPFVLDAIILILSFNFV